MDNYSNDDITGRKIISLFASSVHASLREGLYREFEDGYIELSKLFNNYRNINFEARKFIFTAFAISVCYLNIILPIKSAKAFFDNLSSRHDVRTIRFELWDKIICGSPLVFFRHPVSVLSP